MSKPYVVIVIIEAIIGKEAELKQALIEVAAASRTEKTCLKYHVHQDLNNVAQFVLYENWISKEAHQQQFQKPYLLTFVEKTKDILAKPYQAVMAEEI